MTVSELTGLDIQFAGLITFNGVINMADAIGGVDVCIDGPIEDDSSGFRRDAAGTYTLVGSDALAFLRTRLGVGDGSDLTRISSQQVYMSSFVRKLKSAGTLGDPAALFGLANAATRYMTLSSKMASPDALVSIALALKDIPLGNIVFVQYPGATGGGGVYQDKVQPKVDEAAQLFDAIRADQPFVLEGAGDGEGAALDPNAVPDPAATTDPNAILIPGVTGQLASQYTCSLSNP
jgi:anionic cell wall polymer biosynthesis LytR-Cps2A-Psr (LCP) family protein